MQKMSKEGNKSIFFFIDRKWEKGRERRNEKKKKNQSLQTFENIVK